MLSTPPAFILSQDQTLKLKFVLARNLLAFYPLLLKVFVRENKMFSMKFSNEFSRLFHCLIVNVLIAVTLDITRFQRLSFSVTPKRLV